MGITLAICLLGDFSLSVNNVVVPITSGRLQALLSYLALSRSASHPRQRLAALLWPESSQMQAQTNLRTLLHRLQTVLPNLDQLLEIDFQKIAWRPETHLTLDVAAFEEAIRLASLDTSDDVAVAKTLEQAVMRYSGDFLPECHDEWALTERERLKTLLYSVLERLIGLLELHQEYGKGIDYAQRLLRLDSLNETVYLKLMLLQALNGDRASALRTFHICSKTLRAELGIMPGPMLQEAYERLLHIKADAEPAIGRHSTEQRMPLIGRKQEWKRLQTAWQVTIVGHSRLVVLTGEAGIGKSRLAEEMVRWANRQGIVAIASNCYLSEGSLAYAPVISWLRTYPIRSNMERLSIETRTELSRLLPELLVEYPPLTRPGPLKQSWQRQRFFEALVSAMLVGNRPMLLSIDDLQWCPPDTLEWLHFLLRYDNRSRLMLLATMRTEEVQANTPLVELLNEFQQGGRLTEIALTSLSETEAGELASHMLGRILTPSEAATLYTETEGNPFFVVEMMRGNLILDTRTPRPPAPDVDLPPSVQAVIQRRLDHLTPEARAVLGVAAVIGRSFSFRLLLRATAISEDALLNALDELWQRRIVREQEADTYDFTHDKLRVMTYAELSASRKRTLHRRVAEALEAEAALNLDLVSGQIAMHYEQGGLPLQAARFYERAAVTARHLYANEIAIDYYKRALALLDGQSEAAHLCDQLGEILHVLGRYDEARTFWQRALSMIGSNRLARVELYRKLGNAWRDQYLYDEALRTYKEAYELLQAIEEPDRMVWLCRTQIKFDQIQTYYWLGQPEAMFSLLDEISHILTQYGSKADQARVDQTRTLASLRRDRYCPGPEVVEQCRLVLKALEETGQVNAIPAARFQVGFALLLSNAIDEAETELLDALQFAEKTTDLTLVARCLTYLTFVARKRGDIQQVQRYAERSLLMATTVQMPDYIGAAHANLAWLAWRARNLDAVQQHGAAALSAWQKLPVGYMFEWTGRWPLIGVALLTGDLNQIITHVRILLDEYQQRSPDALETALSSALRIGSDGTLEAMRAIFDSVATLAQEYGYL
jgi:DNA-binding SARP family transcriptional activator/tetratricopeptide (TPR) repeat protein